MSRVVDAISILLLAAAASTFALGIAALSEQRDLHALYWFAVGALCLRSSTDLLRPKGGTK